IIATVNLLIFPFLDFKLLHQQTFLGRVNARENVEFKPGTATTTTTTQKDDDLTGDDLKQYEADIEAMNLIPISIPNDIYNSVKACENAKKMWDRVKRLIQGTELSKIERENKIKPIKMAVNTKFLNSLQLEWYKYVTNVRLSKNLAEDSYDTLFDHLKQNEGIVNASRAKRYAKTHDPLALVANTYASSSSSRSSLDYYVTHPPLVIGYDDDYRGEAICDDQEDSLTTAMMLIARAITQRYATPTNNSFFDDGNTMVSLNNAGIMYFIIGNADRCKEGVIMALKVKSPSSVRCKVGVTMTLKVKSLIHVRDFPPTISNPARESYSVGAPGPTQYVSLGGSSFQVLDLLRPIRKLKAIDLLKDQFRATSTEIDELRGKLAITRVECGERTSHASNSTSITTSSFHKGDFDFVILCHV
nr:hypothetical protein [Tanacetum cinerariifolium]